VARERDRGGAEDAEDAGEHVPGALALLSVSGARSSPPAIEVQR
jgi:hypothetical protein